MNTTIDPRRLVITLLALAVLGFTLAFWLTAPVTITPADLGAMPVDGPAAFTTRERIALAFMAALAAPALLILGLTGVRTSGAATAAALTAGTPSV